MLLRLNIRLWGAAEEPTSAQGQKRCPWAEEGARAPRCCPRRPGHGAASPPGALLSPVLHCHLPLDVILCSFCSSAAQHCLTSLSRAAAASCAPFDPQQPCNGRHHSLLDAKCVCKQSSSPSAAAAQAPPQTEADLLDMDDLSLAPSAGPPSSNGAPAGLDFLSEPHNAPAAARGMLTPSIMQCPLLTSRLKTPALYRSQDQLSMHASQRFGVSGGRGWVCLAMASCKGQAKRCCLFLLDWCMQIEAGAQSGAYQSSLASQPMPVET